MRETGPTLGGMNATRLLARALVRLSPLEEEEDVAAFLQGLVTNDVTGALPAYAALLSAQGKTLFDFIVWRIGSDLLLDCEADSASELVKRLSLYRLRRKIAIAEDSAMAVHWCRDCANGEADPRLPALGRRWLAPAVEEEAGADESWLAHRLACGVAEGRAELGDILWLETNAVELQGVDFAKGCYVGQENTARMNWRQKVNRRIVVVSLEGSQDARRRAAYPELGLAVDHRRTEDIADDIRPAWMKLET